MLSNFTDVKNSLNHAYIFVALDQSSKPKVVNTAINSDAKVQENQSSKSKYKFHWNNSGILNHDLFSEYKSLCNELKIYKEDVTILSVIRNYENTTKLYEIGL
ncbi:5730_t:CDS:2 [Gigaspora margarita]|uniref:5730_t:CDS:1 n=1 Tax=Gigaspora margarita TaxID=4874 RepID=A0ABN7V1R0_GIGMA|nr:5730_t:CDS:2 [Gigaspora margarita]